MITDQDSILDLASLALQAYGVASPLGSATVARSMQESPLLAEADAIGFSATAYEYEGKIVLAIRGTDDFNDVYQGWTTGAGFVNQPQANMAIRFFQEVQSLYPTQEIVLTGHSLGGGLAAYVASLYGRQAVVFDNMAFEEAARYAAANSDPLSDFYNPSLRQLIYGNSPPWPIDASGLSAFAVIGEPLSANRLLQQLEVAGISIGNDVPLSLREKHSMSLLVLALFAENLPIAEISSWETSAKYTQPALFSDAIAAALELEDGYNLIAEIAYTTVGDEDPSQLEGHVAARSFFRDTHTLSMAVEIGLSTGIAAETNNFGLQFTIGEMIAGYAGLLAVNAETDSGQMDILSISEFSTTLDVDFSAIRWATDLAQDLKAYLFSELLGQLDDIADVSVASMVTGLYGEEGMSLFEVLHVALGDDGFIGTLVGLEGDGVTAFFGSGNIDQITGSGGDDLIFTGNSADPLDVFSLEESLADGGAGNDIVVGWAGVDRLLGGFGSDIISAGLGDDTILAGAWVEVLPDIFAHIDNGSDIIFAGGGNDRVESFGGRDIISLGDGDDELFLAGEGNGTVIWGGAGQDTYHFTKDHSNVLAIHVNDVTEEKLLNLDSQALIDYIFAELSMNSESSYDYILINPESDDKIYVGDKLVGDVVVETDIETVEPNDNWHFNYTQQGWIDDSGWEHLLPVSMGKSDGTSINRRYVLDGNEDVWVNLQDTGDYNTLSFNGLTIDGFTNGDSGINVEGNAFDSEYYENTYTRSITYSTSDPSDIIFNYQTKRMYYIPRLYTSGEATVIHGEGAGEYLRPALWDVTRKFVVDLSLFGKSNEPANPDAGDDDVTGSAGSDNINGGGGADTLNGAAGDDNYVYARGDGNDTITEDTWNGTNDRLVLSGINLADVTLSRNGNDLSIAIAESASGAGDAGTILIKNTLNDYRQQGVETFVFENGQTGTIADVRGMLLAQASTIGNDTIAGFNVADTITAGRGNDTINGAAGDDTYVYARGDGNDTITEDAWNGTNDRLVFTGINLADVTLSRNGNDLSIAITESAPGIGDGGSILIKNTLNDYYQKGVETFVFENGQTGTIADVRGMLLTQASTTGNDTITGFNVADTITAGRGNDTINGAEGNDTYVYARGDDNDTITEDAWNGTDRLVFTGINLADVTLSRNGNDLSIAIAEIGAGTGGAGSILIKNTLNDNYQQGVETFVFENGQTGTIADVRGMLLTQASTIGNDTIVGFNVADTITAGNGDDIIEGRGGNDVLAGGQGRDSFVFKLGFGVDTITDFTAGASAGDVLEFSSNLFADFASVYGAASQVGSDTVITFDPNNTITLKNVIKSNLHVDDFSFMTA